MELSRLLPAAVIVGFSAAAAAQAPQPWPPAGPGFGVATASATAPVAAVAAVSLGDALSAEGGPWVFGEVLFFSQGRVVSDYAWRDRVHGRPGRLYTASDLRSDVQDLQNLNVFDRVVPTVYAIPSSPVPAQYYGVAASSNSVRVVFDVMLKTSTATVKPRLVTPPSAVSGLILTPTAFRGAGKHNTPGLGLDFNAAYFIGRLYGKNSYPEAPTHTNYIDRLGIWTLTVDGKMQVQSDADWRPAVAVGAQTLFLFRDSPQPTINTPGVSVKVNAKTTTILTDGYAVMSKNLHGVRVSGGVMQGNFGNLVGNLSEFLTPEALRFYNNEPAGTVAVSRTVPFASVLYLRKPDDPIGVEFLKFNGAPGSPILIDFKIGRLLKLNFDLALLKFAGGYDVLGLFQFRYNHFPSN